MITGIHISSSEMIINKEDGNKNTLPGFKKNQIINAKVLHLLPQGKVQLLVKGQTFLAKTTLQLIPGEEVQLKVLEQKADIILKLMGPGQKITPQQISSIVSFFSKNESMPDIIGSKISGVKEILHDLALKSDKPDDTFLPKLIEKSGMVWEKKVAQLILDNKSSSDIKLGLDVLLKQDIKGNILKALMMADPQRSEEMKGAASFSKIIENFQLLNHQSTDSGRFLLPFPVLNEGVFRFGQLLIDTGAKTKPNTRDEDKVIQISFLLDMTQLGPLRADFSILKNEITGRFLLNDEDTCSYVKSKISELKARLAKIEYHVHQIDCYTAKKEEIQHSSFVETLLRTRDDNVLNIVI